MDHVTFVLRIYQLFLLSPSEQKLMICSLAVYPHVFYLQQLPSLSLSTQDTIPCQCFVPVVPSSQNLQCPETLVVILIFSASLLLYPGDLSLSLYIKQHIFVLLSPLLST